MKYFVTKDFTYVYTQKQRATKNLHEITADPSLKYETFVFAKKPDYSFDEILRIALTTHSRSDYIGATSLIYFKYYNQMYDFLLQLSQDSALFKKHKRAIARFYQKTLKRWVKFVEYSDDTLYPQNEVFRKMYELLTILITK